jgi:hypothetical protein
MSCLYQLVRACYLAAAHVEIPVRTSHGSPVGAASHVLNLALAGKSGQPVLSRYDLLANVVHDGKAGEGSYRCHIHRKVQCYPEALSCIAAHQKVPFAGFHCSRIIASRLLH